MIRISLYRQYRKNWKIKIGEMLWIRLKISMRCNGRMILNRIKKIQLSRRCGIKLVAINSQQKKTSMSIQGLTCRSKNRKNCLLDHNIESRIQYKIFLKNLNHSRSHSVLLFLQLFLGDHDKYILKVHFVENCIR
jgi:hypothetical protein